MSNRRQIKKGWLGEGRKCTVLGKDVEVGGMDWTPIVFDDEGDPDWYKSSSLEEIKEPSHTQQEPERIWVSHFCEHDTLKGNKWDSWFYQFCLSKEIGRDKFPSIKEAIEKVLNSKKDAFFWTDALVQEFADNLPVDTMAGMVEINQFKQSKSAPPKPQVLFTTESEIKGCNVCGGELAYIRGRYPKEDKRKVCPTCTYERLEQINEISSKHYGETSQVKQPTT